MDDDVKERDVTAVRDLEVVAAGAVRFGCKRLLCPEVARLAETALVAGSVLFRTL